jgi:hypothetical protein
LHYDGIENSGGYVKNAGGNVRNLHFSTFSLQRSEEKIAGLRISYFTYSIIGKTQERAK